MPRPNTRTVRRGLRSASKDANNVEDSLTRNVPELNVEDSKDSAVAQDDLNSSPIKSKPLMKRSNLLTHYEGTSEGNDCSSSPIKRKKMVLFSDDLVIPSSPSTKGSTANINGILPLKSILKAENNRLDFGLSSPTNGAQENGSEADKDPSNSAFWQVGTIVQLKPGAAELSRLVAGIVKVLADESFERKFEAYASLNHLCRLNNSETLYNLFIISPNERERIVTSRSPKKSTNSGNYIHCLCRYIQRDLVILERDLFEQVGPETKIDPFCTRIINQALKLMAFLMTDQELNNFISVEHSKWFYLHSCEMTIKPTLSKTLVLSYLVVLKDCKFSNSKRKQIFDTTSKAENIPEKILFSILNINGFSSSSLVVEKFLSLKNLIVNFPTMMAKNIDHWFMVLVVNLCDLNSPLFSKIATMGIQTLLESAKNFIDNKNVQFTVRKFLASNLPLEVKSLSSENSIVPVSGDIIQDSSELQSGGVLAFEFVTSCLEELIRNEQYKSAMDIWVALTLLTGGISSNGDGYEAWPFLSKWLKIHKLCFNQQDNSAKLIALTSWKGIVYNICHNDLDNLKKHNDYILIKSAGRLQQLQQQQSSPIQTSSENSAALLDLIKPKIKLLLHPLLNVTAVDSQKDIIDVLHNLFLSILYTLLNKNNINNSNPNNVKFLHVYWDKVIQPILSNFYFKKGYSNSYMNELGISIICKLLKSTDYSSGNGSFNSLMCLSNEPVAVSDICPLPPKWAFNRFDRIMQNLLLVFKIDNSLELETKIGFFISFLNNLKVITKKEIKPSNSTCDIIDNLPYVLKAVFKNNKLTFNQIYKVIIGLNDTFGPANLISGESPGSSTLRKSVYFDIAIGIRSDEELSVQESHELYGLMYSSIGDRMNLSFLKDLIQLDLGENANGVLQLEENFEEDKENENPKLAESDVKRSISNSSYSQFFSLKPFYQPILNNRRINKNSNSELYMSSIIFLMIDSDFELIVKKLIQDIVMGTSEEFERLTSVLKVTKWTMPIFKYFITLMHDAPHNNLKQVTLNLILSKWEDNKSGDENFLLILEFLVANRFNFELFNLKRNLMKRYTGLLPANQDRFKLIWSSYLLNVNESCNYGLLDEVLLSSFEIGMDVKPYIKNKWDQLPMLKREWERLDIQLYIDEKLIEIPKSSFSDEESDINFCSLSPLRTLPPSESPIVLENKQVSDTPLKTPTKAKAKPTRKQKALTKKKVVKKTPTKKTGASQPVGTPSEFDIHSFTAMLTAKLSTPTGAKEKSSQAKHAVDKKPDDGFSDLNAKKSTEQEKVLESGLTQNAVPRTNDQPKEVQIDTVKFSAGDQEPDNSSNSNISESLEDFQADSLELVENFDYQMFVKEEFAKEKSPELEGTMADKELLESLEEERDEQFENRIYKDLQVSNMGKEDLIEGEVEMNKRGFVAEMEQSPLKRKESKLTDKAANNETDSIFEISQADFKPSTPEGGPQSNEILPNNVGTDDNRVELQLKDYNDICSNIVPSPSSGKLDSIGTLSKFMHDISNSDIASLSNEDSFKIETDILEFIIRMRNIRRQKN